MNVGCVQWYNQGHSTKLIPRTGLPQQLNSWSSSSTVWSFSCIIECPCLADQPNTSIHCLWLFKRLKYLEREKSMEIGHLDMYLTLSNITKPWMTLPHQLQALPIATCKEKVKHDIPATVIKLYPFVTVTIITTTLLRHMLKPSLRIKLNANVKRLNSIKRLISYQR